MGNATIRRNYDIEGPGSIPVLSRKYRWQVIKAMIKSMTQAVIFASST